AGVQDPEGCWRGPARDRVLSPTCGAGGSVARLRRRKRAHAPDAATERTRAEDRTAAGGIAYQRSALIAQRRLTRRSTVASSTPCPAAPGTACRPELAIVAIASGRRRHGVTQRHDRSRHHPGSLARRKTRCQHSIVDLARDREAIELGRGDK